MAQELRLEARLPWWCPAAHRGRWTDATGEERDVVAVLGPETTVPATAARERARPWIGRRDPGLLPLLDVVQVPRRAAWIYEPFDGVALSWTLLPKGELPPLGVAAELVAGTAEILLALGEEAARHPGPTPDDVVLLASGELLLAGLAGPGEPAPAWRAPRGGEGAEGLTWRLGLLLATLLTGAPPPVATVEAEAHEAALRRLLIRIMSRPGPVFPERYRDWLCGMLAWEPAERPVPGRIPEALREVAARLPGPGLRDWARQEVPRCRELARRRAMAEPTPLPAPPRSASDLDTADQRTEEVTPRSRLPGSDTLPGGTLGPLGERDDVTAIGQQGSQARHHAPAERGAMPVKVGPPVEAARKQASLPTALFEPQPPRRERLRWILALVALAVLAAAVTGAATLLALSTL